MYGNQLRTEMGTFFQILMVRPENSKYHRSRFFRMSRCSRISCFSWSSYPGIFPMSSFFRLSRLSWTSGLFAGVCANYRHPGARRVWKGGSELQSHPPFSDESHENQEKSENSSNSWKLVLEQPSYTSGWPHLN